eukprot:TRINITY_DN22963_c1_g1_i1.p1 TRINITY_DN22963_c1_g1~~TRINITY_DN22963_c1_g1_i1.p1  ORF type:complete len:314 (-),score=79.94 TRINITY_DN22963_c1_g1_i1:74-1015(-)
MSEECMELVYAPEIDSLVVYFMSVEKDTIYSFEESLFTSYSVSKMDLYGNLLQNRTLNDLEDLRGACFFKGDLYFLDAYRTGIHKWKDGILTKHFDIKFKRPFKIVADSEGGFIIGSSSSKGLIKVTQDKQVFTFQQIVKIFCVDPDNNLIIVKSNKLSRLSKNFEKESEIVCLNENNSPFKFTHLASVCCDCFGNIYVVDVEGKENLIRMITRNGLVVTLKYSTKLMRPLEKSGTIHSIHVINDYLIGVLEDKQIFKMHVPNWANLWPEIHMKLDETKRKIIEEMLLFLKSISFPKDISIYLINIILLQKSS